MKDVKKYIIIILKKDARVILQLKADFTVVLSCTSK